MNSVTKFLGIFLTGCLVTVIWILLCGWVVMILWNWLMPNIFTGVNEINIWQSYGLMLLSTLLFKTNINVNKKE